MKLKKWQMEHNGCCDRLRQRANAKMGDGLELLQQMERGNETQRALAKVLKGAAHSANLLDAMTSLYAAVPTLAIAMKGVALNRAPSSQDAS